MEKSKTVMTKICDICGSDDCVFDRCIRCSVDHCYNCAKENGVDYKQSVHFSGSVDGYFCLKCDAEIASNPNDKLYKLHLAYKTVKALREENEAYYKDFNRRTEMAETNLANMQAP